MTPDADSELLAWDDSVSPPRLTVRGDWTLDNYAALGQRIALFRTGTGSAAAGAQGSQVDLSELHWFDPFMNCVFEPWSSCTSKTGSIYASVIKLD